MADPHLEQRRGASFDLLARLAFFLCVIVSSLHFLPEIRGRGGGGGGHRPLSLDLPLVSAEQYYVTISLAWVERSSKSHVFFSKLTTD